MQEELITERLEASHGSAVLTHEMENTIVKRVFGGTLWNKVLCSSTAHQLVSACLLRSPV